MFSRRNILNKTKSFFISEKYLGKSFSLRKEGNLIKVNKFYQIIFKLNKQITLKRNHLFYYQLSQQF
jgi:hypothetical protein